MNSVQLCNVSFKGSHHQRRISPACVSIGQRYTLLEKISCCHVLFYWKKKKRIDSVLFQVFKISWLSINERMNEWITLFTAGDTLQLRTGKLVALHDFFHDLFLVFHDLRFTYSFHFRKFSTLNLFLPIFPGLNSSTETNSGIHQNACRSPCLITPLYPTLSLLCHLQ